MTKMYATTKRSAYAMIAVGLICTILSLAANNILTTFASILLTVVGVFSVDE